MTPQLSILIPTLPIREKLLSVLYLKLNNQRKDYSGLVEILTNDDTSMQIGAKRNVMMKAARGEYVCFFDDDDLPSDDYISLIMEGLKTKPTHCSLVGEITFDGKRPQKFIHSTDYDHYYEEDGIFFRHPNHLNTIQKDIAVQVPFPDWQLSEDTNFAIRLLNTGLLTQEYKIPQTIYHYLFITDKKNHDYSK